MSNAPDPTATLRRLFGNDPVLSPTTDPDLADYFGRFALDEVPAHGEVDEHTRLLAVLAALIATTGRHAYRAMLASALDAGVSPAEAKEVTYHAVDYLGYGNRMVDIRLSRFPPHFLMCLCRSMKCPFDQPGIVVVQERLRRPQ